MKGGVGKTTTVIALAETLAAMDNAGVLVIDLDTQASASYSIVGDRLLTDLIQADRTVDAYFDASLIQRQPIPLMNLVQRNASSITHLSESTLPISLLASSVNLRITEREIIHHLTKNGYSMTAIEGQATKRLGADIKSVSRTFDYIILDCAPGISAFTAAAVSLAELVIVPTPPDFLSIYGMQAFVRRVYPELVSGHNSPRKPHVVVSRKRAVKEQDMYLKLLRDLAKRKDAEFGLFETIIPDDPAVSAAAGKRDQTYSQKYPLPISGWYANLSDEVKAVLQ
jgi:cellulose biosynthesis protein BcsQ